MALLKSRSLSLSNNTVVAQKGMTVLYSDQIVSKDKFIQWKSCFKSHFMIHCIATFLRNAAYLQQNTRNGYAGYLNSLRPRLVRVRHHDMVT